MNPEANLKHIVSHLTENIGVRLAGSPEEMAAAKFLKSEFLHYTPDVAIETYPIQERHVVSESLSVCKDGQWNSFPCSLFGGSCGTGGKMMEGELLFFDTETGYLNPDLSYLRGKGVVHLGCHIESEDYYRRLMEAQPAFLLMVDTRYPAEYALADGLFPSYVKKYGAIPTLNVAYKDAWRWKTEAFAKARICVDGASRQSFTSVVIAELKGSDPSGGVIYAGGHHDTQAGTVGADDNAIGSAAVVELARQLSQKNHRRTIRLISFGGEEQLSVGSAEYVRKHWEEIADKGVFMCNFDSFGTAMGWGDFTINGTPAMREKIRQIYNDNGIYFKEHCELVPYTDQFPFAACGVPGIWIARMNCTSGLFYHHRVDNTIDKLDFDLSGRYVSAAAQLIDFLANTPDLSGYRGIPEEIHPEIERLFKEIFGGF